VRDFCSSAWQWDCVCSPGDTLEDFSSDVFDGDVDGSLPIRSSLNLSKVPVTPSNHHISTNNGILDRYTTTYVLSSNEETRETHVCTVHIQWQVWR
jgi:hypothetical protein